MADRPGISLSVDSREAMATLGALTGIVQTMKTNRYTGSVLKYSHTLMAQDFDIAMDVAASLNRKRYHHVYEWDETGNPEMRLWRHTFTGAGATRNAGFEFIASKTPVPTPAQRHEDPNDPTSRVPADVIARLSNRQFFFYWKAPVMEYKTPVTVMPKYATQLFVPSQHVPFYFSKGPITITNSGGDETTGAFTSFWTEWWSQNAERVFQEKVETTLERDLGKTPIEEAAARVRSRNKTIKMYTVTDNDAAFAQGLSMAEKFLEAKSVQYNAAKSAILEDF